MEYDHEDQEEEEQEDAVIGPTDPIHDDPTRPSKTPAPVEPPVRKTRYKECLKNHAVTIGGHAVDGCGEFIPAGEDGTFDSLRCAACACHRNFHRKETAAVHHHLHHHPPPQLLLTSGHHHHFGYGRPSPAGYLHVARPQTAGLLALPSSSGGGGTIRDMELEDYNYYCTPGGSSSGKKRFRTKFTQEQKEKMLSFAEGLGWKIQKQDEESVEEFCGELGIKRHVLKVWMHNNKHTLGKKINVTST